MKTIRIGTRDSELALWQAKTVQHQLEALGYSTEIVSTKSHGDIELSKPLYEMGVTGIFTKALDIALLNGEIDIAVHSMKDVPTALPDGIVVGAVLKRGNPHDVLVYKGDLSFLDAEIATIATSSLRRKAQWLHRYPHHNIENLRGNVNTRLQKLADNPWNGAIFAAAGLGAGLAAGFAAPAPGGAPWAGGAGLWARAWGTSPAAPGSPSWRATASPKRSARSR